MDNKEQVLTEQEARILATDIGATGQRLRDVRLIERAVLDKLSAQLLDPAVIHRNMLAGKIAKIDMATCAHTHGEDMVRRWRAFEEWERTASEAGAVPVKLYDSQWVNIVNHANCWADYSKEDAVHEAVKMTEAAIKANVQASPAAKPEKQAGQRIYIEARECYECGHTGINDSHDTDAACGYPCGWTGPEPEKDKCPGCGRENVMTCACPKCSGHYRLIADGHIDTAPRAPIQQAAPAAESAEPAIENLRGDLESACDSLNYWRERAQKFERGIAQPPEGFALVPCVPTREMGAAFDSPYLSSFHDSYIAMIQAAPQPTAATADALPTMQEAIDAGNGTLHAAIDYWQERALKAEAATADAQGDERATWRDTAERARSWATLDAIREFPATAQAHIQGLARLILTALSRQPSAPASAREQAMEAAINRALQSLCGDYPSMAADLRAALAAAKQGDNDA